MNATASAAGVVVSSRSRAADRRSWPNEVALSVILFAVAFAVRLPYLMRLPFFFNEGAEVLHALRIADGKSLPLTGVSPYQGPFFFYLVAGLIRLFGPHIEIARLVALVGGCFLVVATYWLGRTLWNRSAGLMAACLILTSPQMVIETSHYGWTNSLTPLFVSLTLLATYCGTCPSVLPPGRSSSAACWAHWPCRRTQLPRWQLAVCACGCCVVGTSVHACAAEARGWLRAS